MEESQFPIPSFYAFRYANKAAAGYQHFLYVTGNFVTPYLIGYVLLILIFRVGLGKYVSLEPMLWAGFVCFIIGLIMAIKYIVGFKGVTLYKDHLEITMHALLTKKISPHRVHHVQGHCQRVQQPPKLAQPGYAAKVEYAGGLWRLSVLYRDPPAKRQANLCFRRKSGGLCPRTFRPH